MVGCGEGGRVSCSMSPPANVTLVVCYWSIFEDFNHIGVDRDSLVDQKTEKVETRFELLTQ